MRVAITARVVACLSIGVLLIVVADSRSQGICGGTFRLELNYSARVVSSQGDPVSGVELYCMRNDTVLRATSDGQGNLAFSATVTAQHGCGHECSWLRLVRRLEPRIEIYQVGYREKDGGSIVLEHPFESGDFSQGVREGLWEGQYSDGKLRYRGQYIGGLKVGPWTEWHEDGAKKSEGQYVSDRKVGPWKEWYGTSERYGISHLSSCGEYVDGTREGYWEFWHFGGEPSDRGEMRGGGWVNQSHCMGATCMPAPGIERSIACREEDK